MKLYDDNPVWISQAQKAVLRDHQRRDDVRLALAEVYAGAERQDADALLDQLEARGLKVVVA